MRRTCAAGGSVHRGTCGLWLVAVGALVVARETGSAAVPVLQTQAHRGEAYMILNRTVVMPGACTTGWLRGLAIWLPPKITSLNAVDL